MLKKLNLPSIDPAVSRRLASKNFRQLNGTDAISRRLRVISSAEVQKWARMLIAQYGRDAEELAEIGILEMLAIKNSAALVAWAKIFAAIQELRTLETEPCG